MNDNVIITSHQYLTEAFLLLVLRGSSEGFPNEPSSIRFHRRKLVFSLNGSGRSGSEDRGCGYGYTAKKLVTEAHVIDERLRS